MSTQHRHDASLDGIVRPSRSLGLSNRGQYCPPHDWSCPVLMKLDPQSVAWTCKGCGAILKAPVGEPRPIGSTPSRSA
jgi:hypothetical protein